MINIVGKRKLWLSVAGVFVVLSLGALAVWGLKVGIDFTGGSLLEVTYAEEVPSQDTLRTVFLEQGVDHVEITATSNNGVIFRFKDIDEDTHVAIMGGLRTHGELTEQGFESIGPSIGQELRSNAWKAIFLALGLIMAYITYVFRRVSRPVESWKYGATAIIALAQNLIILLGIFAVLGHFAGVEINSSFIAAFLTVLGFSVHDTIVVFDRTRENLLKYSGEFEGIVNRSLNETLVRSINTSLTVVLVLGALYLFGGESIRIFALALIVGIVVGSYSSICFASPLLVVWHEMAQRRSLAKK